MPRFALHTNSAPACTGTGTRSTSTERRFVPWRIAATAAVLGGALALSACGSPSTAPDGNAAATGSEAPANTSAATAGQGPELVLDSGWAKAGSGMTAVFGTIENPSPQEVTIVRGSSDKAGTVELHTMEKQADGTMEMTEKEGSFVIPAGGSLTLSPGGDHIMLMDLPGALSNGEQVELNMVADDGRQFSWSLPVRSFAGAEESYAPGATDSPSPDTPSATASH